MDDDEQLDTAARTRPTLRTVAAAAGVSTATVSYVLRRKDESIPEATAARVRKAAQDLGYRPNRAAQSMRTGRNNIALLSVQMLSDPWSQAVLASANRVANEQGMTVLVQSEGSWLDPIEHVQPDVAFIDSPLADEMAAVRSLVSGGHRLVVFSDTATPEGFDVVRSHPLAGAQLMMDHLLACTDDITMLVSASSAQQATPRIVPYSDAAARGLLRRPRMELFDGTAEDALRAAVRLLSGPDRPRGVFAASDYIGLAVIQAAHLLGLRVPGDVVVGGLGNTILGASAPVSLTSAGPVGFYDALAEIIIGRATEPLGDGRLHEFAWELIARDSTNINDQPQETRDT